MRYLPADLKRAENRNAVGKSIREVRFEMTWHT